MNFKDLNSYLLQFLNKTINTVYFIVTPTDGSLLNTNVLLSLGFKNLEKPLNINTVSGQTPHIDSHIWKVDFYGIDHLKNQILLWKDPNYYSKSDLKSMLCFDLSNNLPRLVGKEIIKIEVVCFLDNGPTGLKITLSNKEEIWTGPSNFGQNSVFIKGYPELNSNQTYPPNYNTEIKYIEVK